jgi:competence protein ComEC
LLVWWIAAWIVPNHYRWQLQRRVVDFAELTFIDVGHGTSVLIRSPGGKLILYDAGRFGAADAAGQTISGVLWSLGIMRLDAVIVSHADVDHYNALPDLCRKFRINTVYLSPVMQRQSQPSVDSLKQQLQHCRIPVRTIAQGDRLQLDPYTKLDILSPPAAGTGGDDNSDSIVLIAELGTTRVLLPGDLDGPGLQQQLKHEITPVDLAMAPHHGSLSCSPEHFVAWCQADWIVISGDRRRLSPRSLAAYQQTGAQVITTAHGGALRFRLQPREITCQTWLAGWE